MLLLFATSIAHGAVLKGTVVDVDNAPVSGATVWVTQQRQVHTLTTDGSGKFSLDEIDVAMTEVVAYKQGLAFGGATALVVGDADLEIKLLPGDLITLKVLDSKSEPVPGAIIRSMLIQGRFLISVEDLMLHGLPHMRSNDQGILVIPNLPQGGFVQLVLGHPDFADSSVSYLPVEREQRNILLQEGKRVGGRVTYEDKGVSDARVSIFKSGVQGQKEFAEVLTDAEGFYHARVHPGLYGVVAYHPSQASSMPVPVEVPPRAEAEPVNLSLQEPHDIRGVILYPDKRPCGGTRVRYRQGNTVFEDTFTNNKGEFTLRVPGGPGAIGIVPPRGYQTPHFGDIDVDLGEVRETDLKPIRLKALPVISGVIRDEDGKDPGPVMVTVTNLSVPYSIITDEKGAMSLPLNFMPDAEVLHLRAEHGRRFQGADIEIKLKKPSPFEVKLEPFTPDLLARPPLAGGNALGGLIDKPAPALRGTEWLNGEPMPLSDLKGKVVVLLFWAGFDEGIGPAVLQELTTLYHLFEGTEDVAFVSVHDAISSADEIRQFIDAYEIPFPVLRDENDQTTFSTYGIVFIPQVVLIDKMGNVRYYQVEDRLLTCIKGLRRE